MHTECSSIINCELHSSPVWNHDVNDSWKSTVKETPNVSCSNCQSKCRRDGSRTGVEGRSKGGMEGTHLNRLSSSPAWLTLNVFLPTITILFLIVGQLSLLVGLILTHVPIIPIVVRQLRAVLRIYWGLVLIKEPACRRQRRASSGREGSGGSLSGEREEWVKYCIINVQYKGKC